MSIKGWLDLEAQSKQPPFLFPPPTEGPDLMFILRNNKNLNERVLVVIQVCSLMTLMGEDFLTGNSSKLVTMRTRRIMLMQLLGL